MSSRRERPIVASVEDVDECGNIIEGTDRYASSVAPSSPAKEQPNTGRARREKTRRNSSSPMTTSILTDSDSTVHPRRDALKKSSRDRDKSVSSKKALMTASSRPPAKGAKPATSLPKRDEASYYGIDPTITPAISRPRAQTARPASYYAPSRPPPSNARFYASQTPGPSMPSSFPPPPPPWMGPGPGPMSGPMPPPFGTSPSPAPLVMQGHPPHPGSDYFSRPLESRFGNMRPQSAMGYRPPPRAIEYDDYEEPVEKSLARRPSTTRKVSKNDDDRKSMPPPPRRPASARPTALAFRPPPQAPARRKMDFEDYDPDAELFRDLSPLAPLASGSYEYTSPIPFRPRDSGFGAGIGYDVVDYHTEVAGKGRRNSYYGGNSGSSGSAYEDKMRSATLYQDGLTGGPQMPLTADALRKAGRSGASSRSTRSSGSHDESDYRQSATTRTTRSTMPNDEDVTIRVKGGTVFKFGGAEMQCQEGAEINISSRGNGQPEIRAIGSDRSSYIDQDDRRTRVDIPQSRARATSRAKSRPRSYSRPFTAPTRVDAPTRFDPGPRYERYDVTPDYDPFSPYPPIAPPYPEYPSSYSSRHGDGYFGGPPL